MDVLTTPPPIAYITWNPNWFLFGESIFSCVINANPTATKSQDIELTIRKRWSLEMTKPPTAAAIGTKIVPGRIETPEPRRECRCVTRNFVDN
jgi:hypothetical protein